MARKPKTQPNPDVVAATSIEELAATNETHAPARQGRKAKAAAPSPALPSMMLNDNAATSDVAADTDVAVPVDAPRRRGPNRKSMLPAPASAAPLRHAQIRQGRGPKPRKLSAGAKPDPVEDNAPGSEAPLQIASAFNTDPVQPGAEPGSSSDGLQEPLLGLDVPSPTKPAAHWDRATDTARFDWSAIERTAAQEGLNQGMAKLLIAARAGGANSRWPL